MQYETLRKLAHPKKDRGLKTISRRALQLKQILMARNLSSPKEIKADTDLRHTTEDEVHLYREVVREGLMFETEAVLRADDEISVKNRRALVVGSSAGREAFALEGIGYEVVGVEVAKALFEHSLSFKRERRSKARFIHKDIFEMPELGQFDLILLSYAFINYIQGIHKRVAIERYLHSSLASGGRIVAWVEARPFHSGDPVYWCSQLLRLRWSMKRQTRGRWESGDSARAFLGTHSNSRKLYFYHFYQSEEEIRREWAMAGLKGRRIDDIFWIFEKS